mmetsp:Transcript_45177/g.130465  ORF Transcript_45177/g.130465 Transcript_45177/m.130465 type:complete len:114 (+) Transcript_45177:2079-2420(+)
MTRRPNFAKVFKEAPCQVLKPFLELTRGPKKAFKWRRQPIKKQRLDFAIEIYRLRDSHLQIYKTKGRMHQESLRLKQEFQLCCLVPLPFDPEQQVKTRTTMATILASKTTQLL